MKERTKHEIENQEEETKIVTRKDNPEKKTEDRLARVHCSTVVGCMTVMWARRS